MKLFDDYQKDVKWYNRNYFFAGTIALLGVMFLIQYAIKTDINKLISDNIYWSYLLEDLMFISVESLVVSAICIGIVSLFLEKYWGTFKYLVVVLVLLPILSLTVPTLIATYLLKNPDVESFTGVGVSFLTFALYGFAIVTMLFHLKKYILDGKHSIFNWIVLAIIIVTMCTIFPMEIVDNKIADYLKDIKFTAFENLTKNLINWNSLLVGGVLAILCEVFSLLGGNKGESYYAPATGGKKSKRAKDDTGLTFADIMDDKQNSSINPASSTIDFTPTIQPQDNFATSNPNVKGGYAANYNQGVENPGVTNVFQAQNSPTNPYTTPIHYDNRNNVPPDENDIPKENTHVVVGEKVRQYSDYNQYINEKMKLLKDKVSKDKK